MRPVDDGPIHKPARITSVFGLASTSCSAATRVCPITLTGSVGESSSYGPVSPLNTWSLDMWTMRAPAGACRNNNRVPSTFTECANSCEDSPEFARSVNIEGTRLLLRHAPAGARIVHMSSDHVFSGDTGPYDEDSPTDPVSVMGHTRVAAEQAAGVDAQGQVLGHALAGVVLDGVGAAIVDDTAVAAAHQALDHVATHPAQPHHAQLHCACSLRCRGRVRPGGQSRSAAS